MLHKFNWKHFQFLLKKLTKKKKKFQNEKMLKEETIFLKPHQIESQKNLTKEPFNDTSSFLLGCFSTICPNQLYQIVVADFESNLFPSCFKSVQFVFQ